MVETLRENSPLKMAKHAHEHFESLRDPDTDVGGDKLRDFRESALYGSQDAVKHATQPQIQFLKTALYWQCVFSMMPFNFWIEYLANKCSVVVTRVGSPSR